METRWRSDQSCPDGEPYHDLTCEVFAARPVRRGMRQRLLPLNGPNANSDADPIRRTTASVGIPRRTGLGQLGVRAQSSNGIAGTTVTWSNGESSAHGNRRRRPIQLQCYSAGGKFSFTFQTTGTFPYHCTIHPGMVGTVVVQ